MCVSSLRRGHANLLCIVPIFSDAPRRGSNHRKSVYALQGGKTINTKRMVRIRFPKRSSRSGNRTPGASVTGSNVTNYTNREVCTTAYWSNKRQCQAPSTYARMAEWSKALDLSSSGRLSAWVRTPLLAPIFCADPTQKYNDTGRIRTCAGKAQ